MADIAMPDGSTWRPAPTWRMVAVIYDPDGHVFLHSDGEAGEAEGGGPVAVDRLCASLAEGCWDRFIEVEQRMAAPTPSVEPRN